jgi:hypothetical protein
MRKVETRKLHIAPRQHAAVPLESEQSTYDDDEDFAREMLKTKRGIGMTPPFYAETASMKGNRSWPYWIVRNSYCNSLGCFLPKEQAERVAAAMNKVYTMEKTDGGLIIPEDESGEYYVLPEAALQFLPEEWRNHFQAKADDGRVILKSVDNELSQLVRLLNSFATLVTLKYVQTRLAAYKFEPEMGAFLELEMLITAFVVTYARLYHGGQQSGFSRDSLPENLRSVHDEVIDLRNKRFAHHDEHDSVSSALEIFHEDKRFEIKFGISLGFYVGGRTEWADLVQSVEALYNDRIDKLLARLKLKTGHDWALQSGPAPEQNAQ